MAEEDSVSSNKSWAQRTFSPFDSSSLRSSILTLIISALGAGVFTLYKLFNQVGIVCAVLLMLFFMGAYILSMDFLTFASSTSEQSRSLNELVKNVLGTKVGIFYDSLFFMNNFIVIIAFAATIYNNILQSFSAQIFYIIPGPDDLPDGTNPIKAARFKFIYLIISLCVLFPLNRMKSLKGLAKFSFFSIGTFLFLMFLVIFQTPLYYKDDYPLNWTGVSIQAVLANFGSVLFAFNCLFSFYGMKNNLKNPIVRRMRKISYRSFGTLAIICIAVGLASYLSLGSVTDKNFNDLFIFRNRIGNSDYLMIMGRVCFSLSLYLSCAYITQPLKTTTTFAFNHEESDMGNNLSSLFFSFVPLLIFYFLSDIMFFIGLAGTLTTPFVVFIFPALLALKTGYTTDKKKEIAIWSWMVFASLLALIGTAKVIDLI